LFDQLQFCKRGERQFVLKRRGERVQKPVEGVRKEI